MKYTEATLDDVKELEDFWKSESKALGRTYPGSMEDFISGGRTLCIRDNEKNNKIVGFLTYDVLKKKPLVEIQLLAVKPEYRGLGLSKQLIYEAYIRNRDYIDKLYYELIVDAIDGLPNNSFYDKISIYMEYRKLKVTLYRRYYLDIEKIQTWGPSMWGDD